MPHNATVPSLNASFSTFPVSDQPAGFRIGFGIIAFLSFTSNGLLVLFFIQNRDILKNPYSMFLFNLAIVDMTTGVSLVLVPSFIVGEENFVIPSGLAGELYCRVFGSCYLVFSLGIVSVYTITCLAVERWFAVARPAKYKASFKKSRVAVMLLVVWLCPFVMNTTSLFIITLGPNNKCVWAKGLIEGNLQRILAIIEFNGSFFIPLVVTFTAFISLGLRVRHSPALFKTNHGKAGIRLLRMCTITAVVLAISWLPGQISYTLSTFDIVRLDSPFHNLARMLSMSNSFVNPFIYFATNELYRQRFIRFICPYLMKGGVAPVENNIGNIGKTFAPPKINIKNVFELMTIEI